MPPWILFCAAIDNYGDIGVCWRLARQLRQEYGIAVELWVDDWAALARFLSEPSLASQDSHIAQGVHFRHWHSPWVVSAQSLERIAASAVIIEAFACSLPPALISAMANSATPALWMNLEYLSAEDWVKECHALPSPQRVPNAAGAPVGLNKYFFFPGFVEGTGGVLREAGLLERHASLQSALPLSRSAFLAPFALSNELFDDRRCLVMSLFCYEGLALRSLLAALAEAEERTLCLVPEGRSLRSVQSFFELDEESAPGTVLGRGSLTLVVLPFSSQDDYDRLLSICDFNIVRGEDSFVRAQFAGRPMLWHL
ncbi:MAG: elongation factor P maturation arginine rhamnosyltransferase EarP, partial [Bacteroidetes bacterium]|nr:elongation factor P maturation arginine rhamnosyltransferase EarP [Bacteroidota bacterium]